MKIFITILLSSALLGKSFFFFGWEVWYKIDQNRIAQEKCENKARPKLKCNGKCYLAKQLKKLEAEQKKNDSTGKSNPYSSKAETQFFDWFEPSVITELIVIHQESKANHYYSGRILNPLKTSVFHPPCAC
jgi:hypothetical protein